jgi:hypothetical protein
MNTPIQSGLLITVQIFFWLLTRDSPIFEESRFLVEYFHPTIQLHSLTLVCATHTRVGLMRINFDV